ncbi:MAG: hypothetical protein BWX88_04011 [Planctomycetes bacterium ADurb.Bin126]|nr:MAG: hypothetical protein BWX88_04011 [Planctomycetes bacterium ADurb.Bin126]
MPTAPANNRPPRPKGVAIVSLLACIALIGCSEPLRDAGISPPVTAERLAQLGEAARCDDYEVWSRAIRELSWSPSTQAADLLITALTGPRELDRDKEALLLRAVERTSGERRRQIRAALLRSKPGPQASGRALQGLALLRDDDGKKEELEFFWRLAETWGAKRDPQAVTGPALVLLAWLLPENQDVARRLVAEAGSAGDRQLGFLHMMSVAGVPPSARGALVPVLAQRLQNSTDASAYAVVAVAHHPPSLSAEVRAIIQSMAARHEKAGNEGLHILFAIARARIDPDCRRVCLRGVAAEELSGHVVAAALELSSRVFTPSMEADLIAMIHDDDRAVADGAILTSAFLGLDPPAVADAILFRLPQMKQDASRREAARVLRWCAPLPRLPRLRALLAEESDDDVRLEIQDTIRIIELKPKTKP